MFGLNDKNKSFPERKQLQISFSFKRQQIAWSHDTASTLTKIPAFPSNLWTSKHKPHQKR